MRALASLVVVGVVFAACSGGPPPLLAANYARNCIANSDCMAIADTTVCECPLCDTRAININDAQKYSDDKKAYDAACKGTPCSNIACAAVTAYCDNGTCQVK